MNDILTYLFYPNPGNVYYGSPKVALLLFLCLGLMVASFVISRMRRKMENPITKKLSRTWAVTAFWFGLTGFILIVSRVEGIQFVAMRILWFIWALAAAVYIFFQYRSFRAHHYEVIPTVSAADPREKYLPKKKKH